MSFECKRCGKVFEKAVSNKRDFKPQYCENCLDYIFGNEPKPAYDPQALTDWNGEFLNFDDLPRNP